MPQNQNDSMSKIIRCNKRLIYVKNKQSMAHLLEKYFLYTIIFVFSHQIDRFGKIPKTCSQSLTFRLAFPRGTHKCQMMVFGKKSRVSRYGLLIWR